MFSIKLSVLHSNYFLFAVISPAGQSNFFLSRSGNSVFSESGGCESVEKSVCQVAIKKRSKIAFFVVETVPVFLKIFGVVAKPIAH